MKKQLLILCVLLIVSTYSGCVEEKQKTSENMRISSPAFEDGEYLPVKYTCDGLDISPPLNFSNIPRDAKSLALIVEDPDAPGGVFVHWLVWNILPNTTGFSEGENITFPQGINDFGMKRYKGPCPPSGSIHRYFFRLYALDTLLDLSEGATKKQLEAAMSGHILDEAELIGRYGH
jgi:hypothetical protein